MAKIWITNLKYRDGSRKKFMATKNNAIQAIADDNLCALTRVHTTVIWKGKQN